MYTPTVWPSLNIFKGTQNLTREVDCGGQKLPCNVVRLEDPIRVIYSRF